MNLSRRMALVSCLLAAAHPARAARPTLLSRTVRARLRPGGPAVQVTAVPEDEPQRRVVIRATGPGAPAGTVLLPSHYGGVFAMEAMPLRGRDAVLTWMDGLGGTGASQRIGVVIAVDDADRLRVIGLETTDCTESVTCNSEADLHARMTPAGPDRLRLAVKYRRTYPNCGRPGRRRQPMSEAWEDILAWDGRGALTAPPPPAGAGPVRRVTAEARAKVTALLAQPVTDLTAIDMDETGLFAVVMIGVDP